ncbi:uncharacterized protein LOC121051839 [Rosa chinensis]|uniref:uncharacterized protein LOC121051839 n=1 Tax=Rosa chinensis TaxID=74649 RepID=UPI001AD8C6CB|nr:uncharacterized protein LOC121051839 [Rosa chinensis]
MPSPTARPRCIVVGRTREDLVSGSGLSRRKLGRSKGCLVMVSLSCLLGGCVGKGMRSLASDLERLARLGFVGFGSDRNFSIGFGSCGSWGRFGRGGSSLWGAGNDEGLVGRPAFACCKGGTGGGTTGDGMTRKMQTLWPVAVCYLGFG